MKGAEEVKEGHGMEELEVKRSRIEEESSESSDINPFLVEPILRKLLKKVDTVAQLKDLRKMCVLWDNVNLEEIEDRAFKGKLKAIDFQWTDRFNTKKEAQKELVEFLESTRSIPRLFRYFKFNILESLKVLQAHTAFFSDYTISRVELFMPGMKDFKENHIAMKYFLSLIGSNLKEIQMAGCHGKSSHFEPKSPNWPDQELVLSKMEKLIIKNKWWDAELTELFKSALVKDSGRITSLALPSLPGADIGSFPGLDPARMTRLDLGGFKGCSSALKVITGLMTLVEKGMSLVDLGLKISSGDDTPASYAQNLPSICSNLTHFFATQSSTLATLNLKLDFICTWTQPEDEIEAEVATFGKIQLPVFKELHTLILDDPRLQMKIENPTKTLLFSLFENSQALALHFPSLDNLTFGSEASMSLFFDNPDPMELAGDSQFHFTKLKRLEIIQKIYAFGNWFSDLWNLEVESRGNWEMRYGALIGSVDYLRVPNEVLQQVRIPWADSLRELSTEHVFAPLKLAHLKKLEILVIDAFQSVGYEKSVMKESSSSGESSESDADSDEYHREVFTEFLSYFKEATQLNLTYIKFIGLGMEEGIEEEFIRYFPFPVIFEEKFI